MVKKLLEEVLYPTIDFGLDLIRVFYLIGYILCLAIIYLSWSESKEDIMFAIAVFSTTGFIYSLVFFINFYKKRFKK